MLLSLNAPVTGFQVLVVAVVLLLAAFFFFIVRQRSGANELLGQQAASRFKWLRKSALPIFALAFLLIYPFSQPFVRWATNLAYGVGERKEVVVDEPSKVVRVLAAMGDPAAKHVVDSLAKKASVAMRAAQQNATSEEIAADQQAGGGVQLGTFFTKLWITIVFYMLFSFLPFLVQGLTHPAPTTWAKGGTYTDGTPYGYSTDFKELFPIDKFTVYGRIQYVNTAKIIGAALAAALLV